MISGVKKLRRSKRILEKILSKYIENLIFEPKLSRIQIKLRDEIKLFVQYNDFNEYAYSIIFSTIELDRCRFDNYDDKWGMFRLDLTIFIQEIIKWVS